MSTWDRVSRGGKFNANFAKTQKTAETFKKIERPEEKNKLPFLESEYHYAKRKDEAFTVVENTTSVETRFSFLDLGLDSQLLKWIEHLGFSLPLSVQNEIFCGLSEGRAKHNIIKAPKKSGKTSAVLIWVLNQILCNDNKEYPKALIICPTFETADTTFKLVEQVSNYCEIKIYPAMKGKKIDKGEIVTADLVIATPSKALELPKSTLNLKNVKYLIFDDAHYMSDAPGHLKTISQVYSLLSTRCSIILCTIFYNEILENFIETFLIQNHRIEIKNLLEKVIPNEIFIIYSNKEERIKSFIHLEKSNYYKGQTVVFCKTKDESNNLEKVLDTENISVEVLNGSLKPAKRNIIIQKFKENKIKLLITTCKYMEVLEAENVSKVINYDQFLNIDHKLDNDFYGQIENMLNGRKNCLIGSFIEQKWEDALIQPKPGLTEQVYPNATIKYAKELIDGQDF